MRKGLVLVVALAAAGLLAWMAAAYGRGAVEAPGGRIVRWPTAATDGRVVRRLELRGEDRPAILFTRSGSTEAALSLPGAAILEFAVGAGDPDAGGPSFEVAVTVDEGDGAQQVFRETLPLIADPALAIDSGRWLVRRVDLAAWQQKKARVAIEVRALAWPAPFQVPLSIPFVVGRGGESRPSVALLGVDTLRADHLGAYGHTRPSSPNIDALAGAGTVFLRHHAQGGNTFLSFPSIFTGHLPSRLGVGFDLTRTPLPDDALTMTEAFAARGYRTVAIIPDAYAGPALNLMQGFDEVRITRNLGNAAVFQLALDWLQSSASSETPFFLFVHVMEVHDPYGTAATTAEDLQRLGMAGLEGPSPYEPLNRVVPLYFHSNLYFRRFYTDLSPLLTVPSPAEQAHITALYDHDIRRTDDFVGRLRGQLASRGLEPRTVLALISDHGEAFWEHDGVGAFHGVSVYNEIVRTPFIVAGPGVPAGGRVTDVTANVDVMPTLLDLAGLPWRELRGDGTSLRVPADASGRLVVSMNRLHDYAAAEGRWKLVTDRWGHGRLFDIEADPGESRDVAAAHAGVANRMTAALFEKVDHRRADEWTMSFNGTQAAPCVFDAEIAVAGRITYLDSLYYDGVNAFERIELNAEASRLRLRAASKEVDRTIMFEVEPAGADVRFMVAAGSAACGQVFLGAEPRPLQFSAPNEGRIVPKTFTPGRTPGVFIGRLPAWKPRHFTVVNLLGGAAGSSLLTPELRERLRSLGYIQ